MRPSDAATLVQGEGIAGRLAGQGAGAGLGCRRRRLAGHGVGAGQDRAIAGLRLRSVVDVFPCRSNSLMLSGASLRVGDRTEAMKSYVFQAELVEEEDGRWSAGVPALPGCATWGETREDALRNLHDAALAYLRDVERAGAEIPSGAPRDV